MVKKQKYNKLKKLHVQSKKKKSIAENFLDTLNTKTNVVKLFLILCHLSP